ncbi:Zonadhesin [Dissostichus eleginoides]|uniref:Zonadhesin n=1 Tax=Dissostichus eleginoides TaxID=100907 RepID=A0AAD9CIP7_DISEL|nr:Zonadhesin [Dissostichus eleginoides]
MTTTQEQADRRATDTHLVEETSRELAVAPEKHVETRETELATVEETDFFEEIAFETSESISLNKRGQQLARHEDVADEKITLKSIRVKEKIVKVTPAEDGAPKQLEKHIKIKVSDDEFGVQIKDKNVQTGPEETSEHRKNDKAQTDKLSAKSKKTTVEEARTVAVSHEYGSVTPFETTQIKQEHVLRRTSEVPVIEEAMDRQQDTKTVIPRHMISSEDIKEEIRSNLVPIESKTPMLAPIEKNTLKRLEQIDSIPLETTEPEVTYVPEKTISQFETTLPKKEISQTKRRDKSAKTVEEIQTVGYSKKDKIDKSLPLEHNKTETKVEVKPEIAEKKTKLDNISPEKDRILVQTIQDETVKIKPKRHKQTEIHDSVRALKDKPSKAEEIQSKIVQVKDEYGSVAPLEVSDTKQVKRKFKEAPAMEVASETSDTFKHKIVQSKSMEDIAEDKSPKTEVKRKVSSKPEEKLPIMDKTTTDFPTVIPPVMEEIKTDIAMEKDASNAPDEYGNITYNTQEVTKMEMEDFQTNTSLKEKGKRLDKTIKTPLKEVQSKTVVVKDEYGSVTPFVLEANQEQVENRFSLAPVMEVASERCLIVTEGDVRSDTLQRYITPDELIKDIRSTKEDVYKSDDVPTKSKESSKDITVHPVFSKVDVVQDQTEKVSPIKEDLPDKQNIERKALTVSKPEEAYQRSLVEQEASEKRTVKDKITAVLPVEEIKTSQKQTDITDAETENIKSKKSKSLKEKALKLDKRSSEEVQSKSVTVKDEYGSITPLEETETKQAERIISVAPVMEVAAEKHQVVKDGDVKSDTLQRFIAPDKRVKDVGSSREDVYESSEAFLESTKGRVEAEKQKITDKDNKMLREQKQTQQQAEASAVTQQKTRKTLKGDQERSTIKSVQSKTDTVKDLFLSVAPHVETKQDQIERKASRTPVMDVAYEKPLIMKQHEFKFDTPQRFITPDDLVKDITSSKTQSVDVPLKKDEHTTGTSLTLGQTEEFRAQERKSKVGTLVDKTTKVTPIQTTTTKGLLRGKDTLDRYARTGETTQTESFKKALNKSDTIEGIQPKVVMVKDKRATVSPPEGTEMKHKQIERKPQ